MAFVNDTINYGDFKTIDHERNIILRKIPHGYPDADEPYSLEWHGRIIKFRCEEEDLKKYRTETNWKFDVIKRVSMLEIPEDFPESKRAILDVIEDALIAYGVDRSEERTGHVAVEFSPATLKGI
ncbi:MAG: hypothetical protein OEY94_02260 [Alphaproteobacteria bacterium]|nr:hypothetical protein [Alphaproteobacteria bacterium]